MVTSQEPLFYSSIKFWNSNVVKVGLRLTCNTLSLTIIALCCYPHVKMEIGNLIQITTTAPIFQQSHYFRQKYLEIANCAVSLLNNIWVRVEHSLLQQLNSQIINCSSVSLQAGCDLNCGDEFNTSLKTASNILPNIFRWKLWWKYLANICTKKGCPGKFFVF